MAIERLLTLTEFCPLIGAKRSAVYSWIGSGRLREGVHYVYVGRLLRFPYPAALEAFVAEARDKAQAPKPATPTQRSAAVSRTVRKQVAGCPINPVWM